MPVKLVKNEYGYNSKKQVSFAAGWNSRISKEIKNCNIEQIVKTMAKNGIESDFKGNKTVAWCSLQAVNIFNHLNKRYGLKLDLPKAIFVEDFSKLNINKKNDYGICNWYPAYLKEGSDKVYPEKSVIFNSFEEKLKTKSTKSR